MKSKNFYFKPRDYRTIELWKDITQEEWNDPLWQMRNTIRNVDQLRKVIELSEFQVQEIERTLMELQKAGKEALRITPYYASLIDSNPFQTKNYQKEIGEKRLDPIFWQSVPTPANLLFPNTGKEGAMDEGCRSFGAAYQRYPNRVALFVGPNTNCASYCVHCQRAKTLDQSVDISKSEINRGLFYIRYNQNINEVLVTGGDALMISRKMLQYVLEELSSIEHLRVIRIATRVPVVLPMAITDELLSLIRLSANKHNKGIQKYVYFMTHINHYHEITEQMAQAVQKINNFGFTVRNQTVLLNHVNDHFKILAETFRRMFWIGVHPYYLLQCHKEKGIVHFITPVQIGKLFVKQLQGWISGVTMPRYAANIEGGGGKVLLMPSGHDTLNTGVTIDDYISQSRATVRTWDGLIIEKYESLGRASQQEYEQAVKIMDQFIGSKGYFVPKIIIEDHEGKYVTTTNKKTLPIITQKKKSDMLDYTLFDNEMPLTNPFLIHEDLENLYSRYCKENSEYNHDNSHI